jgi:hypothetical protein
MSALYIAIKKPGRAEQLANYGTALLMHLDAISAVGAECGLPRLEDYVYMPNDQIAEFLMKAGATHEEIEKANPVPWYPAEEGRDMVQGYIAALSDTDNISEAIKNKLIPELESFLEIFTVLAEEGNTWHFENDL